MEFYKNDNVVMFDCDDTLVMWNTIEYQDGDIICDPWNTGQEHDNVRLRPHKKHIELLKQFHARGQLVVVWSAGGSDWARRVVELLGLENYVNIVMCKPSWYVDDLHCTEFMGDRVYHADS